MQHVSYDPDFHQNVNQTISVNTSLQPRFVAVSSVEEFQSTSGISHLGKRGLS